MGHKPEMTPQKAAAEQPAASAMSDRQAEKEARRFWGEMFGWAWHHCYSKPGDADYCRVGLGVGAVRDLWKPFGRGRTWEAAFLDAKQRGYCE